MYDKIDNRINDEIEDFVKKSDAMLSIQIEFEYN